MLRRNSIIGKILIFRNSEHYLRIVQSFFTEWKVYTKHRKIGGQLLRKHNLTMEEAAFSTLSQYKDMRILKKTVKVRIDGYHRKVLMSRAFRSLRKNFKLYGLTRKEERSYNAVALDKYSDWLQRSSFLKWVKWTREVSIPKRQNESRAIGKLL